MQPLGYSKEIIGKLSEKELRITILDRRRAIRHHRDQIGDDRCWLDDYLVWVALADTPPGPMVLPTFDKMMTHCEAFYEYRRSETPDSIPADAILDSARWDDDLNRMERGGLVLELAKLQSAIRIHCDIPPHRARTIEEDRTLYRVLPERLPAGRQGSLYGPKPRPDGYRGA